MTATLSCDVMRVVLTLLEDLDTPVSLGVAIRLRYGDWGGLAQLSADPRSYLDPETYLRDAAAVSILKKYQDLPGDPKDRRDSAIAKWWDGERRCYLTNRLLQRYLPEFANSADRSVALESMFDSLRKIVCDLIGARPPQLAEGRFGPGATYSDRGRYTTIPDKMASNPTLTREACWFLPQWLGTAWGHSVSLHGELSFVPGNRFATVPKNAVTDRSIASEPSINVFYQLALGRALRSRLRRPSRVSVGWDLDTAQDVHRQMARISSKSREFATLDLSNASDTVAKTLVRLLLPHSWFEQLDMLRSPKTNVDGQWVMLEKFSSMGNGYTFELETVIFAAIALFTCHICDPFGVYRLGENVFVFGDDIIVPDKFADALSHVLRICGFEVNREKSFSGDTPFRESCGADYFRGFPVRPYYLKEEPREPQNYFAFANGINRLLAQMAEAGYFCSRRSWFRTLDCVPSRLRNLRGPEDLGDIVIHDVRERWSTKTRHGVRYLRALRPGRKRFVSFEVFEPEVVLACATYGTGNLGTPVMGAPAHPQGVTPRDALTGYVVGWVPYS